MIEYRCVCCYKKYFSAEVIICSVCGGGEFLKLTFNMAHPESAFPPQPQPTNSSRKSTNPIGEVKIRGIVEKKREFFQQKFLPEDLERVNEFSNQKAHTSQQQTRTEGVENYRRKRAPTSKKGFKCWKCRKGFTNESELNIHMQNPCEPIHSKPNQYKDGECSEEFSHGWMLKEYLDVHWEVKPFECEHCALAFINIFF
ncbi:hypothetical protein AVEN_57260-1 [Araneus ventricosus]|uniref:C2H2-type domain-containing protein n=1 Tax=Araneus ventricosus TaxID=182803 RepID=A0A4Y2X920_ARAVE|nr:hypothetical protein AVEN_57260-1 [Araneus ventricosus]